MKAALLTVLICLAACTAFDRPGALPTDAQQASLEPIRFWADAPASETARRYSGLKARDGRVDILALSGGGADGAFGAGVLSGWTQSRTRPEIEVVTGLSIGAMLAPYAFLGPEYDTRLEDLLDGIGETTQQPRISAAALVTGGGVFAQQSLIGLADVILTPDVIEAIAREHRAGRRLFVATTELDAQRLAIWDFGAIAVSQPDTAPATMKALLIASASVPAVFPAVPLNLPDGTQELHVDGGTVSQIWVPDLRAVPGTPGTLFAILNNTLEPERRVLSPNPTTIARVAATTVIQSSAHADLSIAEFLAMQRGYDFRLAYIRPGWPVAKNALDFDPESLAPVFERGKSTASNDTVWLDAVPNAYRPSLR